MAIFESFAAPGGIAAPRSTGIRAAAEDYAFSLGLAPGGQGWGDAVREFVLSGPRALDEFQGDEMAFQEGGPVNRRGPPSSGRARPQRQAAPPQLQPARPHHSRLIVSGPDEVWKARAGTPFPRRTQELPESDEAIGQRRFPIKLSALSEKYEAAPGRGPASISHNRGDDGGPSYGTFQMTRGSVRDFLANEGSAYGQGFQNLEFASPAFDRKWTEAVGRNPERFKEDELAFILRTHYDPIVSKTLDDTGLDLDSRSDAVRSAVWSTAVQFGGGSGVLANAVKRADKLLPRDAEEYDDALLTEIYRGRASSFQRRLNDPKRNAAQHRIDRNVIARYRREGLDAHRMLEPEPKATPRRRR
jgi:hypothetical protein